jgi:beta-glucosidase
VQNTGTRVGSDVAQLYLSDPASANEPVRQLRGFSRVTLGPGAHRTVTFLLTARDVAYWNAATGKWAIPGGDFGVRVGDSSALANLPLAAAFGLRPA